MVGQASRLSCAPDRTRCNEAPVQKIRKGCKASLIGELIYIAEILFPSVSIRG